MKAIHRKGHANGLEVKHWNIDFAYQSGLKKKKKKHNPNSGQSKAMTQWRHVAKGGIHHKGHGFRANSSWTSDDS